MQDKPSEMPEMLDSAQRLALAYAPKNARRAWLALFLLDNRLSETARPGREPLMIQLRLSWWRDRLGEASSNWPVSEPVLGTLKAWNEQHRTLAHLVDGWEALVVEDDGGAELAKARVESLVALAQLLRVEDLEAVRQAAREYVEPSITINRSPQLPRLMRPLAVLRAMARREVRGGGSTPLRDLSRIMWSGLLGR